MLDSLRLLVRYFGISVRGQMQYRASFVMLTIGQLAITVIDFLAVWAIFSRFGSLRGWRLPEVAILYGMAHASFALAEGIGRGFDTFSAMVKSGDFDRILLRPRSTALQIAGQELQAMRVGRLIQAGVILWWGMSNVRVAWTPGSLLLIAAGVLSGICIFYGLFVLQATMAFWTIESLEVMNTVTYGGTQTAQYPLSIYRPTLRRLFTYLVPLACMNFLPLSTILGRGEIGRLAPLVGIIFLAASLQIWKVGVRHYCSTGS